MPKLAQHSFIKAIHHDSTSATPWINLGTLYMLHDNIHLAHKAFTVAQSLAPAISRSWVGQAMIAEQHGHYDTLDLFRHAFELHSHPAACLGFAYHVIAGTTPTSDKETFLKISSSQIPHDRTSHYEREAQVALSRYVGSPVGEQDPCALNLLGLLFERQGIYHAAFQLFQRALDKLLALGQEQQKNIQTVSLNLVRALDRIGDWEQCRQLYQQLDQSTFDFSQLCQLGLFYFHVKQYPESFQVHFLCR